MSKSKIVPEIRAGDLMGRMGYNIRFNNMNAIGNNKTLLELQTKDINEFVTIFKTLDSLLKMFEEKGITIYISEDD